MTAPVFPPSRQPLRLLCVHAHPDDESSKGAATMARYVDEGVDVLVVSCTGGERGDILNPALADDPQIRRDLAQLRRDEMRAAQEALGVRHLWLGFVDSGLPEGDPLPPLPEGCFALEPLSVTTEALVRVIRDFRPHVVTTYNELGGYPHPDHIMTHRVTMAAVEAAGDRAAYPSTGRPWQPLKTYYDVNFSREKLSTFHEAIVESGGESPFEAWLARRSDQPERRVTTRIDVRDWLERRDAALLAHATQIDPEGVFFAVPLDRQREIWPWDEYEAAVSYVPVADGEDDLFAGLREVDADELATGEGLTVVYDGRVAREEEVH